MLGRTLGVGGKKGGFGDGGQATNEREVRQDIRQFDGRALAATFGEQFVREQLFNGLPGRCRLAWGAESHDEAQGTATLLKDLSQAGLEPDDQALTLLSDRLGFQIRRAAARPVLTMPGGAPVPGSPGGVAALSIGDLRTHAHLAESATDNIAREAAAPLARAFRENLAGLQRIILESRSAGECEDRARQFLSDYRPGTAADVLALALEANTANGAVPLDA